MKKFLVVLFAIIAVLSIICSISHIKSAIYCFGQIGEQTNATLRDYFVERAVADVLRLLFLVLVFFAALFVVVILIKNKVDFFTRYTYEQYCSRREAKRAARQEKKRQRLQEKLERMSREHE